MIFFILGLDLKSIDLEKGALDIIEEVNKDSSDAMELDIILDEDQKQYFKDFSEKSKEGGGRKRRETLSNAFRKWPNGRMPYIIDNSIDSYSRQIIAAAISIFQGKTCIQIVPRLPTDNDYVVFRYSHLGCFSNIGRTGGAQSILIGSGCRHLPVVLHEIMHALGFFHEQSRLDRDDHVTVIR